MATYTDAELLEKVRQAIADRMDGKVVKSYSAQGVRLDRDPLSELAKLEKELQEKINAASGPGFIRVQPL